MTIYGSFIQVITIIKDQENTKNTIVSTIITIVLMSLNILIIQYFTYVDFIKIFKKTEGENINLKNFLRALYANLGVYAICAVIFKLYYFSNPHHPEILSFSNPNFIQEYIVLLFVYPAIVTMLINKFIYYRYFTVNEIKDIHIKNPNSTYSSWKQLFFHIDFVCLHRNGMAQIFLFRVYNSKISMLISLVLFIFYSKSAQFFTKPSVVNSLAYNEANLKTLKIWTWFLCVNVVYSFISLIDFYYFPKFSIQKQVYDSLFLLNDDKLLNSDESNVLETCERSVLESYFINEFINFDPQSEYYYVDAQGGQANEIYNNIITKVNYLNYLILTYFRMRFQF